MPPYYPNQHGNQNPGGSGFNQGQSNQYQYGINPGQQYPQPQNSMQMNASFPQNILSSHTPQNPYQQQPIGRHHQQNSAYLQPEQQVFQYQQDFSLQSVQQQQQYQPLPTQHLSQPQFYQLHQQNLHYSPPPPPQQLPLQSHQQHQFQGQGQPRPAATQTQQPKVLQDAQPNVLRQQPPPIKPLQSSEHEEPDPDYAMLLLCLADEYLEASSRISARSEDYFKLTATALGCIESVLNNFKLSPLREAQVSLKYAQLLYNETDNNDDAETILTKTIEICERMKFVDLKYAGQLLLARVLHRSNSKAAIKDLQSILQDIETYKHAAWEYAVRLQLVSFFMASALPNDIHSAITQLERLAHAAKHNADNTIYAFAAVLETLAHLQSSNPDAMQAAQRALAKARAMQLNDDVSGNPQLVIMMEFLDLCIHIKESDVAQGEPKRKMMQSVLYSALENPGWRNDGVFQLPISQAALRGLQTQDGGVVLGKHGKYSLALAWLPKDEVEDLGYLLSGVSAAFKNAGDNGKAEKFFDEGLEMLKEMGKERSSVTCKGDIVRDRRAIVETHFLIERVFLQCSKGQWSKAESTIETIEETIARMTGPYPPEMSFLLDYIKGSVAQGQGRLDDALKIFAGQIRRLYPEASPTPGNKGPAVERREDVYRNVSILAAMNTIFIIQQSSHPQHRRLQQLVNMLDQSVHNTPNKTIQAAWNFILSNMPNNTIIKTKQSLSYALSAAQAINNAQVTTLCLTAMHDKFFQGVIGDQAIKCARAATHQAKRLNDPLWISVTTGLESYSLNIHGMTEEAMKKEDESERTSRLLPEKVRSG